MHAGVLCVTDGHNHELHLKRLKLQNRLKCHLRCCRLGWAQGTAHGGPGPTGEGASFGGIFQPVVKYTEYPAQSKVIW